jgi:ankyrin repeat protein
MGQVRDESTWREFFAAVEQGDAVKVREFLKKNSAAATAFDNRGETALHLAAQGDHADVVKLLLAAGADPNARSTHALGESALHVSARQQRGRSRGRATSNVMRLLIAAGAQINLPDTREGSTPLHQALHSWNLENAELLLKLGANPNAADSMGRTPLFAAMHKESIRVQAVRLLLAAGASARSRDKEESTPLHFAAFYGDAACVQVLLDAGANANAITKRSETALQEAARQGHLPVVRLLIKQMTREAIALRDEAQDNALSKAARTGNAALIELLMQHGLQPDMTQLVFLLDRGAHLAAKQLTFKHQHLIQALRTDMEAEFTKVMPQYVSEGLSRSAYQVHTLIFLGRRDEALARLRVFEKMACGAATPLMDAVQRGDQEAARTLLELGANPNVQVSEPVRAWLTGPGPMSSSGHSFISYEFAPPCQPVRQLAETQKSSNTAEIPKGVMARFSGLGQIWAPPRELSLQQLKDGEAQEARSRASHFLGSALIISVRQRDLAMAKLLLQFGANPRLASLVPPSESAQSAWLAYFTEQPDSAQWRATLGISQSNKP